MWRARRQSGYQPHKKGLNSKLHLADDEYGIPADGVVTSDTLADCSQAPLLLEDFEAEAFLADKAYDTNCSACLRKRI
jgi:hypothetical protein